MKMSPAFDALPDHADCWIYASDRLLDASEVGKLNSLFASFEQAWSSHGRKVVGACEVIEGRVVVVAAHVAQGDISGCGIDKSLHLLQEFAAAHGFTWASALNIVHRDDAGTLNVVSRKAFRIAAAEGRISEDTRVMDLSIRNLGVLRNEGLERRVQDSWHAALLPATAGA